MSDPISVVTNPTPDSDTPNPRYTLRQAAKLMGKSPDRLGRMIKDGAIPPNVAFYSGHRYIIWRSHFDRWIGIAPPLPERNSFIKRSQIV